MTANKFDLTIQTPENIFYDGQADFVHMRTALGEIKIYKNHAPLSGTIDFSWAKVRENDREEDFILRHGMLFVDPDTSSVKVLAYSCEKKANINFQSLREYKEFILSQLNQPENLNKYQVKYLEDQKVSTEKLIEILEKSGK